LNSTKVLSQPKTLLILVISLWLSIAIQAQAIDVYESPLSKNAICISLDQNEVAYAKVSKDNAQELAIEASKQLLYLAGVPESVTGKVASVYVWVGLTIKYRNAIYSYSKSVPEGNSLTLKFFDVDLEAVKRIWNVSSLGDNIIPGGELEKALIKTINTFSNAVLR